ncbi:MAG: pyrroline-5-carboxylate reductase [Gammaproteobacteria bacterium]|nr:pyrroline-5-carboxylate reductase [Gammaproteobacteria bacterium]MBT8150011.1 pyrroline-5-carboxylate reductase [Gammaproteobacteria bacterium]NND40133.1 pyrroline-5-carboxylate reductase [Pseudomonadales bacterium]NNL10419.1 pyrroline-5-carboxylate reductase [Pseudomonadales bacterium]RZV58566.1 MAG: pyrroline-5-carboxylate reductase [Pseudomonadales bacterium]
MARSLIGGLCAQGVSPASIATSDLSPECLQAAAKFGVQTMSSNQDLVAQSDVVLLAVKPQVMAEVVQGVARQLAKRKPLLVSIAAGISCSSLLRWSAVPGLPIVRCMPNTPALLQCGATGLYASGDVSGRQRKLAEALLAAVGVALWVEKEGQLDAVTAVSGSGPAYFFLLMEHMQRVGEQLGLSKDVARELTVQTALGAARMAQEAGDDVATLRANVTSPNGTTHAAIESFMDNDFDKLVEQALSAAARRSIALAEELG